MRTLLILRHAKSSWKDDALADHDRPLNRRGLRDAPRIGELLQAEGLTPERILTSDALRARTTAGLVAEAGGFDREITLCEDLYLAAPQDYVTRLSALAGEVQRVLIVGHNPGLEQLLEQLTGEYRELPTAALAEVELPITAWTELNGKPRGKLKHLWLPRELD